MIPLYQRLILSAVLNLLLPSFARAAPLAAVDVSPVTDGIIAVNLRGQAVLEFAAAWQSAGNYHVVSAEDPQFDRVSREGTAGDI